MSKFVEVTGEASRRGGGNTRVSLTIVKTARYGKRVKLSKGLLEELGNPSSVQISMSNSALKIGENLKNCNNIYQLTGEGDTIYRSGMIDEITEHFGLDFSGRTSLTFDDIEVGKRRCNGEEVPYAVITMVGEGEDTNE